MEFQDTILRGCDFNRDGKINKKELTMILLALSKHSQQEEDNSKWTSGKQEKRSRFY